jgi:hypothetical protein
MVAYQRILSTRFVRNSYAALFQFPSVFNLSRTTLITARTTIILQMRASDSIDMIMHIRTCLFTNFRNTSIPFILALIMFTAIRQENFICATADGQMTGLLNRWAGTDEFQLFAKTRLFFYIAFVLPIASAVVKRPNTRKGCAEAWYLTSFATGSGKKNLSWK